MTAHDTLALDFKSATLYTLRIVLHDHDMAAWLSALDERMAEAGGFFENEPVVIDATAATQSIDWATLLKALKGHRLHPVGVVARGMNLANAQAHGLAPVDLSVVPARAPVSAPAPETPSQTDDHASSNTLVVNRPLRSGQRVYARGSDLIVIGMVSQGAEVIADGHIHVYGPLRGKAMAGAQGNQEARIFTTELDPELLAIAGIYRVIETALEPELRFRPAVVQRQGDSLDIQALGAPPSGS